MTPVPIQPTRVICGEISRVMPSKLLGSFTEVERGGEHAADERGGVGLLRRARAGDVEASDAMFRQEGEEFFGDVPDR